MRFVTSCITRRSPQTFAGATLLRAFSVVLADGPTWASRSQSQSGVQPSQKPNSAIFVLMTNLGSQVIEEDSPHRPAILGAFRHHSGDAVLHVGLCRQNADATVNDPRRRTFQLPTRVQCSTRGKPQACPQQQTQDQATSPTRPCGATRTRAQSLYHNSRPPRSSIPEPLSARGNFLHTTLSTEPGTVSKMRTQQHQKKKTREPSP